MLVALTGGIGSGKSTVARMLAQHGAAVIDADAIAREVVAAGTVGFEQVVATFGSALVGPDGELDRPALAAIVFADDGALVRLNAIVHPLVAQRSAQLADAADGALVVYDVPLLVETGAEGNFAAVLVVEASLPVRLERLAARGVSREQAQARIAAQASDKERRAVATAILSNDGDLAELRGQVDEVFAKLMAMAQGREEQ